MTPAMSRGIRRRQQKDFAAQLQAMNCDPTEILVMIATNNVPCSVCQRTPGKQRVALPDDMDHRCICRGLDGDCWRCSGTGTATATERTCQSCYGTLFEAVPPDVRGKYAAKMLDKLVPDLRSVEVKGSVDLALTGMVERLLEGRSRAAQIMEMPRLQIAEPDEIQ